MRAASAAIGPGKCEREVTEPAAVLAGKKRVWWVDPVNLGTHKFDQPPAPIVADHYREIGTWHAAGFQIRLFARP